MDCIVIPAGVPHGVPTCGTVDLQLVWVHDAPERLGVSVYMDTAQPGDSDEHIHVVRSEQWTEMLCILDAVHVRAGGSMVFWNHGDTQARLLWLHEQGQVGA